MSVPNFRKSYHMGFEKNCRKSRLSKQFDKTGNSGKSIQPKIGDFEEDLTKIVGGVGFQRLFDKTGNNRKSIQPKIGAIERRIRLDPRNPMVPHFYNTV